MCYVILDVNGLQIENEMELADQNGDEYWVDAFVYDLVVNDLVKMNYFDFDYVNCYDLIISIESENDYDLDYD